MEGWGERGVQVGVRGVRVCQECALLYMGRWCVKEGRGGMSEWRETGTSESEEDGYVRE
jgi:hypothetical protein